MKLLLIVGAGSFCGGVLRYLLASSIHSKPTGFPFGTFVVNLIGCFLIGCLFSLSEKWNLNLETRLLLMTGFLGGFTTFSAFSIESYQLLKSGQIAMAILYVTASIVLGIALTFAGVWIFKSVPTRI